MNRCVNEVTSLPEERDQCTSNVHSKGNRTAVSSMSSNAKPVLLPKLEAMKKQEEMDEQLAAKKRQVEIGMKQGEINIGILEEELAIAKLEEEIRGLNESQRKKWKELERRDAAQAHVCEASRQYPSTAIRSKR